MYVETIENESQLDLNSKLEMHQLRHQVFKERLGWDVQTVNGLEIDEYDRMNPTYMIAQTEQKRVDACWRMLPTQGPYMLADVFPQLLCGENVPRDERIWEISRWAASACSSDKRAQAHANQSTMGLIKAAYDYALENDISHYIVVTSVSMEKLVKRIGLPIRRFGNGKAVKIGNVLSVACWVEINAQFHDVVYPMKAA